MLLCWKQITVLGAQAEDDAVDADDGALPLMLAAVSVSMGHVGDVLEATLVRTRQRHQQLALIMFQLAGKYKCENEFATKRL